MPFRMSPMMRWSGRSPRRSTGPPRASSAAGSTRSPTGRPSTGTVAARAGPRRRCSRASTRATRVSGARSHRTPSEAGAVELHLIIEELVAELSPAHRQVVELHVFEGVPAAETCERVDGMSPDNVAKIASRFQIESPTNARAGRAGHLAMDSVETLLGQYIEEHRSGGDGRSRANIWPGCQQSSVASWRP